MRSECCSFGLVVRCTCSVLFASDLNLLQQQIEDEDGIILREFDEELGALLHARSGDALSEVSRAVQHRRLLRRQLRVCIVDGRLPVPVEAVSELVRQRLQHLPQLVAVTMTRRQQREGGDEQIGDQILDDDRYGLGIVGGVRHCLAIRLLLGRLLPAMLLLRAHDVRENAAEAAPERDIVAEVDVEVLRDARDSGECGVIGLQRQRRRECLLHLRVGEHGPSQVL